MASDIDNLVDIYSYKDGVAGELVGTIAETHPTGMCSDNQGNVYIAMFYAHRVDKFAHAATTAESSIKYKSAYPYACAVDNSNGNLAVSIRTGHNKFDFGWFVDEYNAAGSEIQSFDAFQGFEDVHGLAFDSRHDLFAIGVPCAMPGYCFSTSRNTAPALYQLTASGSYFHHIKIKGVTLVDPVGMAWINPSIMIADQDYKHQGKSVGIKVLVDSSGAKVIQTIAYRQTKAVEGIAFRAGVVLATDRNDRDVRSYSISDGSLLSTLKETNAHPQTVTVSQ